MDSIHSSSLLLLLLLLLLLTRAHQGRRTQSLSVSVANENRFDADDS